MSIGNSLRVAFVCSCLAVSGCTQKQSNDQTSGKPLTAWWYEVEFAPDSAVAMGLAAGDIDRSWNSVAALDARALAARISPEQLRAFQQSRMSLTLTANLDGDGIPDTVFVGVYATSSGDKGRFVAITEEGRLVQHFSESGTTGFSALVLTDDRIQWFKCMECGEFETITWAGDSYRIE